MKRILIPVGVLTILVSAVLACTRPGSEEVVYVTATSNVIVASHTPSVPTQTPIRPTPNATRASMQLQDGVYTVQPGDTLAVIAARFGVNMNDIMLLNGLTDPNVLEVGQLLQVPTTQPVTNTPGTSFKIVPDSEIVYGPTTTGFDVAAYVKLKAGFLRIYSEQVGEELLSGVEIINAIALDYSVNPRLLLALLEYKGGWLSNPTPESAAMQYPLDYIDPNREGLYSQLLFAANTLNYGYYGWRYRGLESTTLTDGTSVTFAPDLNGGTVAMQFFFAQMGNHATWTFDVSEQGFFQTYLSLFGDPFRSATEPIVPSNLEQPALTFPFPKGETWYFTGGPHGGYNTGSAWSAIDFAPPAPPEELLNQEGYCYVSPYWTTAVAPGVIARSGRGYVILDLDYDGNEHTGWVIVYLHMSSRDIIEPGTQVKTGDRLAHPSCEGGFSTATHLHFGRRYNGEWIPADCSDCLPDLITPSMVLSGWRVFLQGGAEYQGYMTHPSIEGIRRAEQGRENPINHVSY